MVLLQGRSPRHAPVLGLLNCISNDPLWGCMVSDKNSLIAFIRGATSVCLLPTQVFIITRWHGNIVDKQSMVCLCGSPRAHLRCISVKHTGLTKSLGSSNLCLRRKRRVVEQILCSLWSTTVHYTKSWWKGKIGMNSIGIQKSD